MTKAQINNLLKLSKKEKAELAMLLWNSVAEESYDEPIPDSHKRILDERTLNEEKGTYTPLKEALRKYKK